MLGGVKMKINNKQIRAWLAQNEAAKAAAKEAKAAEQQQADKAAAQRELSAEKKHTLQIDIGQSVYLKGDFRFHRRREYISLSKGTWYGKPYHTVSNGVADCVFVDFPHVAKIVNKGDADNFSIMKLTRLA